jgi:hypothetical protein
LYNDDDDDDDNNNNNNNLYECQSNIHKQWTISLT